MPSSSILRFVPHDPVTEDGIVDGFIDWEDDRGITLYPHQEEALLALAAGDHVIAATPTGSGKSTIGYAALFTAFARGERAVYTAPIKALVSEKFFELVAIFGAANVGMATGDATVNHDAPIMVCTEEILANEALRDGADSDIGVAVLDEFHYYGDSQRGWAWQVPLIELPDTRFVLMSATLGDVSFFVDDLQRRTGRTTTVLTGAQRPVPLDYKYVDDRTVQEEIEVLLEELDAPVYVVHFTQRAALDQARALLSTAITTNAEKEAIRTAIGDFRFSKGFGQILSRLVRHGIGVHHAGMLPKYRRLVERLAQAGLLKVICGTDTLGVGINVPIRTVLFTSLAKYDGSRSRVLGAREFHQIAGRAGRAGYDTVGHVVALAPEWTIEAAKQRKKALAAAAGDGPVPNKKRKKKQVGRKAPEGAVTWSEDNFTKLEEREPAPLTPHFQITSAMILQVISRPGNAVAHMRHLLFTNHMPRKQQFALARHAIELFRGLIAADVVEVLPEPDAEGRRIDLLEDLQLDFALNQPLAPFAVAAIDLLDEDAEPLALTLDTVSVIEAILDDPFQVLLAQTKVAKNALFAELKADGVEYLERQQRLDEVTYPKPLDEMLHEAFEVYRKGHPWVSESDLSPKSIVREMYETGMTFSEYVSRYELARSEGVLLRYLSDAYHTLSRTVPMDLTTDELDDLIEWLGVLVRGVDSSLLDEWDELTHPEDAEGDAADTVRPTTPRALSAQTKVLTTMVRQAMWLRVQLFALEQEDRLGQLDGETSGWTADKWADALDEYFDAYEDVELEGDARSPDLLSISREPHVWRVRQALDDPEHEHDWGISAEVDLPATDEAGELVLRITDVGPMQEV